MWPPRWWVQAHCEHTETTQDSELKSDDDGLLYYDVICSNPKCGKVVSSVLHESCAGGDIIL